MDNFEIRNQNITFTNPFIGTTTEQSLDSADEKIQLVGVNMLAHIELKPTQRLTNHKIYAEVKLTLILITKKILSLISNIFSFFSTKAERDFKKENPSIPLPLINEAGTEEPHAQTLSPKAR